MCPSDAHEKVEMSWDHASSSEVNTQEPPSTVSVTIKQNWDSSQQLAWITAVVILHNVGVCGQQPKEMELGDGCFCVCFMMVISS